jgi:hypothetical protein
MAEWGKTSGDVGDFIQPRIDGVDSLASVTSIVVYVTQDDVTVVLSGSVTDAVNRIITVGLSPWLDTAAPGDWWVLYEIHFAGGKKFTWPEKINDRISVRANPQAA